ncbi:MAG TPA: TonB-dependent receptor [Blastocatellia bacterium]|nr:TonB-dependent receptor [Blastocatellia bacterium]
MLPIRKRVVWRAVLFMALTVLAGMSVSALAQQSIATATLSGRVVDPTGAVIQNAQVTAIHLETNSLSRITTDTEGRFRFANLRLGKYEITVNQSGFADRKTALTLTVGSAFNVLLSMDVAKTSSTVQVSSEAGLLEAARTQIAGTVQRAEIENLPLNGRNFLDLALVVPGVSPTNTASTQLFAETAAVPGQGISISSQRNLSNSFIVDGLSNNDDAAGLTAAAFGIDVINEFQVVTSGGQAEFGRALGGYINVATKSGTNSLHGNLYGYLKNKNFNAANPILRDTLPMTQAQYGASVGGPLRKDRTFYFANFERRELNQSGLTTIPAANVASINARLLAIKYPGQLISTGVYPNPVHTQNYFGKVDHQLTTNDQLAVRYSFYGVDSRNSRGAGGLSAPSASANLFDHDHSIAVSNVATIGRKFVNETRGQFTSSNLEAPPSDPAGPAVSISGVASFGTLSGSPTGRKNRLYEVVDNVSFVASAHAIRLGATFLYNDDTITYPRSFRGSYSFSSLANFLSGTYNNAGFTQTFANSVVSQGNANVGVYLQDEWHLSRNLTINAGLRYDLQYLKTINTDTNNVSPRLGIAWTPFGRRTTVVRAGYGLYYDRVPLRALANALLSAGNTANVSALSQISISLSPTQSGAPVFPNILSTLTIPAGVLFNFTTMNPNMQNAYSTQANLEIEQQIGKKAAVSIGYQHVRGLHLIVSINQNVPTCVASGSNNGCRPNPNYANNSQYSPNADSRYDGLHLSFVQRPSTWSDFRLSYTYSKALNNVGEFFFSSPLNPFNIWQDYARSDDDQRHRFVLDGSLHTRLERGNSLMQKLTNGFKLSAMMQYYSALPFNITTGSNTIQGTAARPTINGVFISRNFGKGFNYLNLSARLSRTFYLGENLKLEALAEGFNLTNHVNGVSLNGVFGTGTYPASPSATFGQMTGVADSRSFQFALRLVF